MSENTVNKRVDYRKVYQEMKKHRRLYLIVLPITLVLSAIYIYIAFPESMELRQRWLRKQKILTRKALWAPWPLLSDSICPTCSQQMPSRHCCIRN